MTGDVFLIYLAIIKCLHILEAKMYCDRNRNPIKMFTNCFEMRSRCFNEALCKKHREKKSAYQKSLSKANWFIK